MHPFLNQLDDALSRLSPFEGEGGFAVAFSGGADSTSLLVGLLELGRGPVRALHVDHALHANSALWERHCRRMAGELGVPYRSARVAVEARRGESLEALAREARYKALREMLAAGEVLLTAHTADDQLETVLLRLFRGSGAAGLRGIVQRIPFEPGFLARPMLDITRAQVRAFAQARNLRWLDDPANEDMRFDRSFLRVKVLPLIEQRWPAAARSGARFARHMADVETMLEEIACRDALGIDDLARIPCAVLGSLPAARQRNLLRYAIRQLGLPLPTASQLETLRAALEAYRPGAKTQVQWPGGEARVYRGRLYLFRPFAGASASGYRATLHPDRPWEGPEGRVELQRTEDGGLPDAWVQKGLELRFRAGGERFRPRKGGPRRSLKQWLQEAGIVPWMRGRIPLLYHDGRLVAVGDLWIDSATAPAEPGWRVRWSEHPALH